MNMNGQKQWKALDSKVLVVAVEGAVEDWACYIGVVRGDNHQREYEYVARRGTKLPQKIAELLFPNWKHLRWRR